jgi:glycosyltransferase involved in cell wall biosynthesis
MHIVLLQFYAEHSTPEWECIAKNLRQLGHRVWSTHSVGPQLIISDEDGEVARFAEPPIFVGGRRGLIHRYQQLRLLQQLRRFLREVKPDVVQVNPSSLHWLWFLPFLMPPTICFIIDWRQIGERNTMSFMGQLKNLWLRLRRYGYSRFFYDKATFLHEAGAHRAFGPHWRRWAAVVPMGVEDPFFTEQRVDVQPRPEQDRVRFLYIGSLSPIRQLERILDAVPLILQSTDAFSIDFIGADLSQGWYQSLIDKLNIGDHVRILPPVPYTTVPTMALQYDVAFAYVPEQPADWQYHPTLKVLEYRALGLPIIATDVVPNRETVLHEQNGLLIPNTSAAIADAMLRFIQDHAFLTACTTAASTMRQGHRWREVAVLYETLYESLCQPTTTRAVAVRDSVSRVALHSADSQEISTNASESL